MYSAIVHNHFTDSGKLELMYVYTLDFSSMNIRYSNLNCLPLAILFSSEEVVNMKVIS